MLKIKDKISLEILKDYGFIKSHTGGGYYKRFNDNELFIWTSITDPYFKFKEIGIDTGRDVIIELDILYDLIKDDLIEKVIEEEYKWYQVF